MQNRPLSPLAYAGHIGWEIVLPLLVCALGGRYLDGMWSTTPFFFIAGLIVSLIISTCLVMRTVARAIDHSIKNSLPDT